MASLSSSDINLGLADWTDFKAYSIPDCVYSNLSKRYSTNSDVPLPQVQNSTRSISLCV